MHAPKRLVKKRPDLRIDRIHGATPETTFSEAVDEVPIAGFRLEESVLFHRSSRALIVADLVHNVGRPKHWWTKLYTRIMGFYDRVALSRMIRWAAFPDHASARQSVDKILELPFDKIIVGHGTPITTDARATLRAAYQWLPRGRD